MRTFNTYLIIGIGQNDCQTEIHFIVNCCLISFSSVDLSSVVTIGIVRQRLVSISLNRYMYKLNELLKKGISGKTLHSFQIDTIGLNTHFQIE